VKKVGDEIIAENKKLKFNDDSTESDEERNTKKNFIDTLLDPKNNFSRKETIDEITTFIVAVSFFKKYFDFKIHLKFILRVTRQQHQRLHQLF
jgi:hypothetical protein